MNELPPDIQEALKKSPAHTPPESFYRGVLDRIDRSSAPRSAIPPIRRPFSWGRLLWSPPIRFAGATLGLMIIIYAALDKASTPSAKLEVAMTKGVEIGRTPALAKTKPVDAYSSYSPVSQEAIAQAPAPVPAAGSPARSGDTDQKPEVARKVAATESSRRERDAPALDYARDPQGMADQNRFDRVVAAENRMKLSDAAPMTSMSGILPGDESWLVGTNSAIDYFRTAVITSEGDWRALWREHTANRHPAPAAPPIDFRRQMVVGVFLGQRPSGGYQVEIAEIKTLPDQIAVEYREVRPNPHAGVSLAVTQPFVLRAIEASSLPIHFHQLNARTAD